MESGMIGVLLLIVIAFVKLFEDEINGKKKRKSSKSNKSKGEKYG